MSINLESLKYPIGQFIRPKTIDKHQIEIWIQTIEHFPKKLKQETENITEQELEIKYRPNGWTIKQVVNHCADSHMNSFIRFKLALTEDIPTIKPYFENLWAELPDSKNFPIESSLKILEGLHERWHEILINLSETELNKQFLHPETNNLFDLKTTIGIYAWHCEHHLAHIKIAINNS
jgi:hypothetical protein